MEQTLEAWREEGKRLFGKQGRDWKFVCPRCENVQSPQDFVDKTDMGKEEALSAAYQMCIGRHFKEHDCNWSAYGLFGTMGKGRTIITPEGEKVSVFDFYQPTAKKDNLQQT
ncbi:VVA0879 family protein [Priestia megaterium]|uniref:VVA0879 family protein n=1 Tax=Priestia megaterium TaxID=1404 RepID=UPI003CFD7096